MSLLCILLTYLMMTTQRWYFEYIIFFKYIHIYTRYYSISCWFIALECPWWWIQILWGLTDKRVTYWYNRKTNNNHIACVILLLGFIRGEVDSVWRHWPGSYNNEHMYAPMCRSSECYVYPSLCLSKENHIFCAFWVNRSFLNKVSNRIPISF